jgi:hypothetical protein
MLNYICSLKKFTFSTYIDYRDKLIPGVSVSGSVPRNPERMWVPGSRSQEPTAGSGFPFPETHSRFRVLRNRNSLWVPVLGNPEPISNFCEKTVKGYVNIPLCLKIDKNEF